MWSVRSAACVGMVLGLSAIMAAQASASIQDPYVDVLRLIENDLANYEELCSVIGNTGMSTVSFAVQISDDLANRLLTFRTRFVTVIIGVDPTLLDAVLKVTTTAHDLASEVAVLKEFILLCKDRLNLLSEQLRRVLDLPFIPRPRRTPK